MAGILVQGYLMNRIIAIALLALYPIAAADMLTYHNDNARSGQNVNELVLRPSTLSFATFGKRFTISVDGKVDAQPLYASGVTVGGNPHNLLITATEHGTLYVFDADTGVSIWSRSLLGAGETPSDDRSCGQVTPEIGITSTPVIDRNLGPDGVIYAVAMSKSGTAYFQRLHAIDLLSGNEMFGGPVTVQATYQGTGDNSNNGQVIFDPKQYKARPGLLLQGGALYIGWSSHCDIRPYTGWITSYNALTLHQVSVINITPNGNEASFWQAGAGLAGDSSGNVYALAANGTFDATLDGNGFPVNQDYGNAFLKFSTANGILRVADYFNMHNTVAESGIDQDLGSGGALVLPDLMDASNKVRHLAVGAGKDKHIYVVDRDNMGKFNPSANDVYQDLPSSLGGSVFGMPAYFNGRVYVGAVGDFIRAFSISQALLAATPSSESPQAFGSPGPTPSISANATLDGILWAAENSNPAVLHAYDATNLATELYNSNQAAAARDHFGTGNKFITPTINNGKVYVGTTSGIGVFGMLPGSIQPVIVSSLAASAAAGQKFSYQIQATNGPTTYGSAVLPSGLSFDSSTGLIAGVPESAGTSAILISATNSGGTGAATLTLAVTQGPASPFPRVALRDIFGGVHVGAYPSSSLSNAGGIVASDITVCEAPNGDTYVTGRDASNAVWINVLTGTSQIWQGWVSAGGVVAGTPAVTVTPDGKAWVTSRDASGHYWINSYQSGAALGGWTPLEGIFDVDPSIASAPDGSIYIVGRASGSQIWSGHYVPGSGFSGWVLGNPVGPSAGGQPAVTVGSDGSAYVAVRQSGTGALWLAQVQANAWGAWQNGGGAMALDPHLAATNSSVFAVAVDMSSGVWMQQFLQGPGNGWQGWTFTGGTLAKTAAAALDGDLYIAGADSGGTLWWYRASGPGWTPMQNAGIAAGTLAATPH
jgi:hypothetical protein